MTRPNAPRAPRALALLAALAACRGGGSSPGDDGSSASDTGSADDGSSDTGDPNVGPTTTSTTTRRLSLVELQNSYQAILGTVPTSLASAPPDSFGLTYDRIVNAQTISPAHLEAFAASAREAGATLIASRTLDDLVPTCTDAILPPLAIAAKVTVAGAGLSAGPEWAVHPNPDGTLLLQYAPDPTLAYSHPFAAPGTYEVTLAFDVQAGTAQSMALTLGATELQTWTAIAGDSTYVASVEIDAAGPGVLEYAIVGDDSLTMLVKSLTIDGPTDAGASFTAERQACAAAIVDTLAPRAFRRPITDDERMRLIGLVADAEGQFGEAYLMLFEAIFANPSFLYLVEVGTPIDDAPGTFALDAHEIAARMSYALCEGPPDAALRAAADAGELATATQIDTQVRRLFDADCGHRTVARFVEQWLWIDRVLDLDRDPKLFPSYGDEVAAGMVAESERYVDEMIYREDASLATLLSADHGWPDPRSAFLYGLSGVTEQTRTVLPPERAGILTHPSVLTATSTFDATLPVRRGVFVLEQVLCQELAPPPASLMVTPPAPDPEATTRERWAQHSSDPSCSVCHQSIDPIGFTFEAFDAIGRHRTTENGLPVDARGGVPALDIADGSLDGAAALARAVASSPEATRCFARQWLRFSLARMETELDADSLAELEAALAEGSLKEALIALTATTAFSVRQQEVKP